MSKAPEVNELREMGAAWAEEHYAADPSYGRFGYEWAYASLADCVYEDAEDRCAAASLICDFADIRWAELKKLEPTVVVTP